jgi:hypothetical protein
MRDLVGVAELGAEHGRHELHRVVRLQERSLVAEERVGGRVRLVEAVARELVQDVEDRVGGLLVDAVERLRPGDELPALLGHGDRVLLPHGPAQHVGAPERVAGDDLRRLHHLLLVDHHPVGLAADLLEELVRELDGARVLLAADVVGDPVHRARAGRAR